jgi:hypothetical protein
MLWACKILITKRPSFAINSLNFVNIERHRLFAAAAITMAALVKLKERLGDCKPTDSLLSMARYKEHSSPSRQTSVHRGRRGGGFELQR